MKKEIGVEVAKVVQNKSLIERVIAYIQNIFSQSTKASSMRFVFVLGTFFTLTIWAVCTIMLIIILAKSAGLEFLAACIGAMAFGAIGIIGSLAGMKAKQTKYENTNNEETK